MRKTTLATLLLEFLPLGKISFGAITSEPFEMLMKLYIWVHLIQIKCGKEDHSSCFY